MRLFHALLFLLVIDIVAATSSAPSTTPTAASSTPRDRSKIQRKVPHMHAPGHWMILFCSSILLTFIGLFSIVCTCTSMYLGRKAEREWAEEQAAAAAAEEEQALIDESAMNDAATPTTTEVGVTSTYSLTTVMDSSGMAEVDENSPAYQ